MGGRESGVFSVLRGAGRQAQAAQAAQAADEESAWPGALRRGGRHQRRNQLILLVIAAAAVIAAGVVIALVHDSSGQSGRSGHRGRGSGTVAALRVLSITPAAGSRQVDGGSPILVQFSAPLAAGSPRPVIRPAVAGTWRQMGDDAAFVPARALKPHSSFTVEVPAGLRSSAGGVLARGMVAHFTTRAYSQLMLAQLLAQLGYLPLRWSPAQTPAVRSEAMNSASPASQQALAFNPPPGTFTWQRGYPSLLASMWRPGRANVLLRGAVMAFESEHGMTTNAALDSRFWTALFRAAATGQRNANGYTYAVASKGAPETLTIWHDGRVAMRSLANTGIPVSPTVDGTFPVYLRFRFQIMRGTNPDGSSYADPVSFVSYFNGGDAVHYFPRGGYGYQQSLGCVELPYSAAEQAYPYLTYGSLVTVTG
jgi:hypothetical protein